jgi:amino acid transporter
MRHAGKVRPHGGESPVDARAPVVPNPPTPRRRPAVHDPAPDEKPQLNRTLGLAAITLFGVGDILGAGVYGLVGKIAGTVGTAAWMSYVAAGLTAALTGLTYAELTSRFPRAGGAAHFCATVYRRPALTFLVIWFVALSGLFSMGVSSRIFANYALAHWQGVPPFEKGVVDPLLFVAALSVVAVRGIELSSWANALCTTIEVAGLLAVIAVGARWVGSASLVQFAPAPDSLAGMGSAAAPIMVLTGASLAFFAFVGFEDMANLSEEVRDAERNVPLGICLAIAVTTVIYCTIAVVSVSVAAPDALKASPSPVIDVVRRAAPDFPVWLYSVIPAFAVFNTALLNLLMASRLFYGMARQGTGLLPGALARVHPRWRTPHVGVAVSVGIVATLLVCVGDIAVLASGTATLLLVVFVLLHGALVVVKRDASRPAPRFRVPMFVPVLGVVTGLALLARQERKAILAAAAIAAAAAVAFAINWLVRGRIDLEAVD